MEDVWRIGFGTVDLVGGHSHFYSKWRGALPRPDHASVTSGCIGLLEGCGKESMDARRVIRIAVRPQAARDVSFLSVFDSSRGEGKAVESSRGPRVRLGRSLAGGSAH